jgi:hypothetical protein
MSFKKGYKGFKIFGDKMICRDMEYKVGETYTLEGELIICENGFHFCEHLVQCFEYYDFEDFNTFCEVEAIGDVVYEEPTKHKAATNKIKIIKVLDKDYILSLFDNKGKQNTGNSNTGDWNTGDWNTGDRNTGDRNTGNLNTGDCNTGSHNTGDCNTGGRNTGYRNTGNWNTGSHNTGYSNTGSHNTGYSNTGNWNVCDRETGFFNTKQPKTVNVFNKPCDIIVWENTEKPDFIYFDVVPELGYKGSFQKSFDAIQTEAKDKQITLLKQLPNFDKEVFFEISGILIE